MKPIERRPSHHESIVKAKTLHSLSKNYPVIGERFEGELAELPHQPEAKSVDLFDTISFVSSSEDSGVGGDTAAQRPKPKKTGLKCLWCGPSKSQRKPSEESLKAVNVNEQQVQRRNVIKKAETYALSEHYPVAEAYSGEVVSLNKAELAPEANLFDLIEFVPSSIKATTTSSTDNVQGGFRCIPCVGKTPRDLTDRQILFNQTAGYPAISEPYTGDVDVLTPNVEASSADLFDCVEFAPSDEVFAQSGYNKDTLKSKTSTLEKESGTVRRLRLFTKSRAKPDVFTTSGSYPEYFVYEGPVEDVKRTNDFETTPLRQSVDVYHSGKPFVMSKFTRERLPGIEEIGEPTGSYAVCEIREGETVPLHAFASLDTVPLAEHAKRPVVSQSEKIPSGKFKRKYSKTRNIADADADSSSQSSDELPKSSFKQKREEGEGFFTFFRNRIGTRPQKKTGFEGLMVPDDTNVRSTVLEGDLPSTSIHEHVHVYHHGYSNVHQTIDSGFEDGPNASETDVKRGGTLTWRQSGRFFDKFKRGTKRPSADEAEKPESVIEVKTPPIQTHYEHLEQTPYLGLYSSTERNVDMDPIPLSTAVEHIPIGHYPGHAPVPVEFVTPTQKSAAIEHQQPSTSAKSTFVKRFSRDSRQDRDPHYAYGLSSAKFEGDHSIVNKDSDTPEHPIGEYVTVYHCGKSDVPTTPVPAEFYEVSPERTVSTQYPNSTPTSEFESIAETNVTLERSPVAAYGQVVITDSDRTEAAMTSYSIENVYEDAITSTPRADELSAEPLREQTIVYHSGRSSSRDASERNALVADTSADRERRDLVHRLLALFRRNPRILEGYPEITAVCTYEGPLAEFTRSDDLDQHDLHSLANVYHSGFSDDKASKKARKNAEKQRRRALKKLKVNLNDYPHDDEPIDDAHVFNLYAIRDVPQSPAPATLPADTFYSRRSHPRHRFLRRFRRSRQPRASELAIALRDAPSRRDDYSTATFSMVISDKSLFTRGHWPVTDIDVDVVLTKQRHIDCEFETTVATKRAYDSAIAGGPALSRTSGSQESGAGSSANWCRVRQHPDGSWFAEVSATLSAVPQQKEESVDEAIEVARGAYVITEEPSFDYDVDLCSLVDIDDEVVSKPGEGKSSDCGLSSKFGDSLTRLSLASDDDDNIMFSAITRRLSEKLSKKNKKEEDKRRKKEEKEAAKRAKKDKKAVAAGATKKRTSGGGDADSVSSSSSSSDSDAEHEERHVVVSQAVAGPVEPLSRNQELGDLHGIPESRQITMAPQTAAVNHVDANSSGPYTPAKDKDGRVLREETVEQVYRISGSGKVPKFDPTDMSLQAAVDKCVRETDKVPRVQMVEANILVKENEPLPQALREGSAPHTTVHTWHETEAGPEKVTTEVDKYGNKVTRTVKTQHTKHTIQKQSYQTYAVDGNGTPVPEQQTVIETTEETSPLGSDAVARSPVVHTKTRTVAYEKGSQNEPAEPHGELVSSKTITTGNRTVEILTYKTEKDGVIETRVEHRVTIHSGSDIDHDAELAKALLEATEMSPDLLINRVEVEKSTQN
uniref:4_1_CTD domain-containing protein n=1 Tax=Panagrellus redivivus TaxID=6233 RepID=A0A7E4VYJ6_PANRE